MQHNFTEWNGDTHVIPGCCMSALGSEKSNNVYTFNKSHCKRTHGPNVTKQLQQDKRDGKEMATSLNIGDWVLFDSKMADEPIWLGRVMSNPQWEGMGVLLNNTRRKRTYENGVEISTNEVAIFVQWYEKIDINSSELTYRASSTINKPQVQSNFYLLYVNFDMHEMNGQTNTVPRLRSVANNRDNWYVKERRFKWQMDKNDRQAALAKCGINN